MIQVPWQALPILIGIFGFCGWLLRLMFRAELAEFKNKLLGELNGRYMNAAVAQERLEGIMKEMQQTRHDLRNEIHMFMMGGSSKRQRRDGGEE